MANLKLQQIVKKGSAFLLMLCFILFTKQIKAQGFYSIANYVDSVYAQDTTEDGPKANITRMKKRWEGQFDQNGSFTTAAQKLYAFTQNLTNFRVATGSCQNFDPYWKEIGPTMKSNNSNNLVGAGQINNLTFHPQYDGVTNKIIYATSFYGGIWKTTDDGENWTRLNTDKYIPYSSIGELLIDPTNPNRMYATTGKYTSSDGFSTIESLRDYPLFTLGIYGSDDGGLTWQQINNGITTALFTGGIIYNIDIDPLNNNNLIFTSTEGVFVSTNASNSLSSIVWNKDLNFASVSNNDSKLTGLTYNPTTHEWFVAGLNIYSNPNPFTGGTWINTTGVGSSLDLSNGYYSTSIRTVKRIQVVNSPISIYSNDVFAMIYTAPNWLSIFKKVGNSNWQIIKDFPADNYAGGLHTDKYPLVASPNNGDFYLGSTHISYYNNSTNTIQENYALSGGLHADVHAMVIHPSQPNKLWICSDGGLSLKLLNVGTYIDGASYKNNGIQSQLLWQFDDSEMDKDYSLGALQDNGCQFIDNLTSNEWKTLGWIGDGYNASINNQNSNEAIFRIGNTISLNKFNHQTNITSSFPLPTYLGRANLFEDPQYPSEKIFVGHFGIHKSNNGGFSYHNIGGNTMNQTFYITYNSNVFTDVCGSALIIKSTHSNYNSTTPVKVYGITNYTKVQADPLAVSIPACQTTPSFTMPSIIFKSNNGYGQVGGASEFSIWDAHIITNNLYNTALSNNAITTNDFPVLSGITCKPENGNKVWVCSNGLLPSFKVWGSSDGGTTWQNADPFSVFANIPVFDLVAMEGSKDIVFAGTMDGVYYTDNTMNGNWCRYGENSPSVQTMALKINPCKNKLIVTTYGRGAFEVELPQQDLPIADITTNTTWTTPQTYEKQNLRVKSGATLTIKNTTCEFGANVRIIVEANAKLIVDNSTLTSASTCNGYLWSGMEAQGDINFPQTLVGGLDPNHGIIQIKNNSIVQNAYYATQNSMGVNGGIDWAKLGGGIVQCNNSTFLNCQKATAFIPYKNHNSLNVLINDKSYFTHCNFITNATTASHNFIPETHASMWDVRGVNFKACTFKNETPNSYELRLRGNGIITYDAAFDVVRSCEAIDVNTGACAGTPCTFENLFYGLDVSASLPTNSVRIENNVFTNNHRGAVLHAVDYAQVIDNTFTIGEPQFITGAGTTFAYNPASAIYLDACDAFVVQNNSIDNATATSNFLDYGIVAHYSDENPNELRQNKFKNITVGIQAQENNEGLQLKCNKFDNTSINSADVKVVGQFVTGSIASQQGYCSAIPTTLPGNEFSHTCGASAKDLDGYNMTNQVTYNTRPSNFLETPATSCYDNTGYFINPCNPAPNGDVCPSNSGGGLNPQEMRLAIKDSKQSVKNLKQLLDGGNAPTLYNAIATQNENQVKNKLLNKSPYLSDAILLAFIEREPTYSDATIRAVLLANSPVSLDVYNAMNDVELISIATKNAVKQALVGTSQRTYTERALAYEQSQLVINYNRQLSYVLNNRDNVAQFDTLKQKIDLQLNPQARLLLASSFIQNQQYSQAQTQIDSLSNTNTQAFMQQNMAWQQQANKKQAYSGAFKTYMDSLRNSNIPLAVRAQAIHNGLFKKGFGEKIYISQQQASNAKIAHQQTEQDKLEREELDNIRVYPNPTNGTIYFAFKNKAETQIQISLYNINGQLVKTKNINEEVQATQIDTDDLIDGIYFYRITSELKLLSSGKIVLIK